MALSILDGNQSATTLSTILSSGQHITAHTVVSLGTQAITDIVNATSSGLTNTQLRASAVTVGGTVTVGNSVTISSLPAISGTVTIGSALPAGTNNIGVVTANFGGNSRMMGTVAPLGSATTGYVSIGVDGSPIGSGAGRVVVDVVNQSGNSFLDNCLVNNNAIRAFGTVTIGAGTAQIGSVTASISGTVPISISSVTIGNSVTIGSLPAISGTVTANLSISSTAITSGSFTSLTSATLVPANTARKMATVYNLGAGQLFVNAGASATTLGGGFMVALSSGDFYECDYTTTTLSAIFATAGTASWFSH
jgi:hypothetical protein